MQSVPLLLEFLNKLLKLGYDEVVDVLEALVGSMGLELEIASEEGFLSKF